MQNLLAQWWATGTMVSEFVSSMLLALVVYTTTFALGTRGEKNNFIKWMCVPFAYGFGGMCAIYIGMSAGNAVADGEGLALMSAPFTFVKAIYFNTYNLVIAALAFQLLGALTGVALHLLIAKIVVTLRKDDRKITDGLIFPDLSTKENYAKESIAQFLFVAIFVFITVIDYGFSPKGNLYFGIFISSILITVLFRSTTKWYYFMLSPQILIASLVAGHFFGLTKLKHWKWTAINITIQFSAICLIAHPEYAMRTR